MKIVNSPPPDWIYNKAKEKWGVSFDNVVFTVGDTIHAKNEMSEDLIEHEKTHIKQQTEMGVEKWWNRYFEDSRFRYTQEIEAYRNQYKCFCTITKNRSKKFNFLKKIATDLSGRMYGNVVGLNEAVNLIRK